MWDSTTNGVFVASKTSVTAAPLSLNYGSQANDQLIEVISGLRSPEVTKNQNSSVNVNFTDTSLQNSGNTISISIPVKTAYNPNSLGIAFRNHGKSGVGHCSLYNSYPVARTYDRSSVSILNISRAYQGIHGVPFYSRAWGILDLLGTNQALTYQVQETLNANGGDNPGSPRTKIPTGNAGSGFLYYSPRKSSWIEKRFTHSTSGRNLPLVDIEDTYPSNSDIIVSDTSGSDVVNILEYSNNSTGSNQDPSKFTFHVTGADRIMGQFTGSPNIGYLLPWKECLESQGYSRIGWPTSTWGAPTEPKYHAFQDETIKLNDYIDRPFILSSIELSLNIEAARAFLTSSVQSIGSGLNGHTQDWSKYIMNRRDIENYSFFIYRQRRRGGVVKDSIQDISSSERFLIASASLAFYNSASFGGSYKDQYWLSSSIYRDSSPAGETALLDLFYNSASFLPTSSYSIGPDLVANLSRWTEPLHNPAFSYNWGLSFTTQSMAIMTASLNLSMKPSVAPYGITAPTLMTFVGGWHPTSQSNGFIDTVQTSGGTYSRPGWYHTGSWINPFVSGALPITQIRASITGTYSYPVMHFWHGNTRIPQVYASGTASNRKATRNLGYAYGDGFEVTSSTNSLIGPIQTPLQPGRDPAFASSFVSTQPVFSQYTFFTSASISRIDIPNDIGMLVDGRALNCTTISPGAKQPYEESIQGESLYLATPPAGVMAAFKGLIRNGVGSLLPSTINQAKIKETEYLLLPGDELVLGLENSNFATPDFTALYPSGSYKDLVLDFLPFSYLRVLPGIGEIKLIGRYLRDGESYTPQKSSTGDITTVIGDVPYDEFIVTETDGYYGGIFDEIITGSIFSTTQPRGVAGHATVGDIKGNFSLNRFFTVYSDNYIRDYFTDPVRDTLRTTGSIQGSTTYGYRIPQKAVLSSIHYGYLRDFLETPQNVVLATGDRKSPFSISPVTVKFVEKNTAQFESLDEFQKSQTSPVSIQGGSTTSQNVNKFSRLDGPYKDGQFTDRDELEYTVTV